MSRRHLCMDQRDNVTTLIDEALEKTCLSDGRPVDAGIPFGHKVALTPIGQGEAIIKYGVVIGYASCAIRPGEHVHVHNCR